MERFVIDAVGPDPDAEREGVAWLVDQAAGRGEEAAVIVPDVRSIENLARAIGAEAGDVARRERRFKLDGVSVAVLTLNGSPGPISGPALVLWANTKMVEETEALGPRTICASSWAPDDLDEWKRTWSPIDLRAGKPEAAESSEPGILDALVQSLTSPSGASDVLHPSDKRRAVNAFKALVMQEVPFDPNQARVIARQRGWTSDAADRLEAIAEKAREGRPLRGGDKLTKAKAKDIVSRLEELARTLPESD